LTIVPIVPDLDCSFSIIKSADTTRNFASGYSFDDHLQFDVIAGKTYRVCGFLKIFRENNADGQVLQMVPKTEGDPEVMVSLFKPNTNGVLNVEDGEMQSAAIPNWPAPYSGIASMAFGGVGGDGPSVPRSGWAQVHCVFKAKEGTSKFGIYWGVTSGATGTRYWSMLEGSWIDVRIFD